MDAVFRNTMVRNRRDSGPCHVRAIIADLFLDQRCVHGCVQTSAKSRSDTHPTSLLQTLTLVAIPLTTTHQLPNIMARTSLHSSSILFPQTRLGSLRLPTVPLTVQSPNKYDFPRFEYATVAASCAFSCNPLVPIDHLGHRERRWSGRERKKNFVDPTTLGD